MATRKNKRRSGTRKAELPQFASTMPSITYWYTHLFARLGWVMLAKAQGKTYRVVAYKKSIDSLLKTIDHVCAEYEGHNRKHDLNVMKMHVESLKKYVMKHL